MQTTEDIYNEIITEKDSGQYPELDELNSTSKVAIWRLWVWIFAFFSKSLNEIFISFKEYINNVFAKNQAGTLLWWIVQIKAFQYGDLLIFMDGIYKYPVIDETKQIVKQVALENQHPLILFKVANEDINGDLIPLDPQQVTALEAYIHLIKFPGTHTQVISQLPDNLRLNYRIYYNAMIDLTEIETEIIDTVNNYLANIVFNGIFSITKLTDEIQKVQGVINPIYTGGQAKTHYQEVTEYSEIIDYYTATAGYMSIDTLNLDFIANV